LGILASTGDNDALAALDDYATAINLKTSTQASPVQIFGDIHPLGALMKAQHLLVESPNNNVTEDIFKYMMKYVEGRRIGTITRDGENELNIANVILIQICDAFPDRIPLFLNDLWHMVKALHQQDNQKYESTDDPRPIFFIETFKGAITAKNFNLILEIEKYLENLPGEKSIHKYIIGLIRENHDLWVAFYRKTKQFITKNGDELGDESTLRIELQDQEALKESYVYQQFFTLMDANPIVWIFPNTMMGRTLFLHDTEDQKNARFARHIVEEYQNKLITSDSFSVNVLLEEFSKKGLADIIEKALKHRTLDILLDGDYVKNHLENRIGTLMQDHKGIFMLQNLIPGFDRGNPSDEHLFSWSTLIVRLFKSEITLHPSPRIAAFLVSQITDDLVRGVNRALRSIFLGE
jgi:hypothetical protein